MPRCNVSSLKKTCMLYVSSHLHIWCGKNETEFRKIQENNGVLISFLPKTILDEMINRKSCVRNLHPYHVDLFMHEHLQELNLSCSSLDLIFVDRVIKLICDVCKNISKLDISYTKVDVTTLEELVRSIPSVTELCLQSTATSDSVLSIVGNGCLRLQHLDIRWCRAVTDAGVRNLCDETEKQINSEPGGKCKLIRTLLMMHTSITRAGAKLAILKLQYLHNFDYQNTLDVVETIYKENNCATSQSNFRLKLGVISCVKYDDCVISGSAMNAAVYLCPFVFNIELTRVKNTVDWIPQLAKFPYLTTLSLTSSTDSYLNFDQHIASLLMIRGKNLESLELVNFENVDLWHIGSCCSQLHQLYLGLNRRYADRTDCKVKLRRCDLFSKIYKLIIQCLPDDDIPNTQLEIMLSNSIHMESLILCRCQSITDGLLSRVVQRNSFPKLCYVLIHSCNNLHKSSILTMLQSCNSLIHLTCALCAGIQVADKQEIEHFIQEENMNIHLSINHIANVDA